MIDKEWMDLLFDDDESEENEEEAMDPEEVEDHDGHRDRMRCQMIQDGFDYVKPKDLLELMLCYVQPRQDVNSLCDELLECYGDLQNLLKSDLEEFSRFEGLGEEGAQWLDSICTLARLCCDLKKHESSKIANFRQLRSYVEGLLSKNDKPCCIQLLSDGCDRLLFQRKLSDDLLWGESNVLAEAADDAFAIRARNSYMILLCNDALMHPTEYDLCSLRNYAHLLQHSKCVLRDVLFMNEEHCISLHQMRMMDSLPGDRHKKLSPSAAEEELPMPAGGLIVHRISEDNFY